jgi:hypothetical protein
LNEAKEMPTWRKGLITVSRVIGWTSAVTGFVVCIMCAILFFNRSPGGFEGMVQVSALHVAVVYGLPLLVAGSMMGWFAGRARRAASSDTSYKPKVTP